ncbi:MAG: ROK family transcriptional regulator [Planctomycetota bacterium]|nr:ROK family transcriptional regulator [Planctomycetota bacterium]
MDKNGKNLDDLQDLNRSSIIRHLAMYEGCSRVELAKSTGLKQASITKIIRALLENGVVVETGFTEGLKGRRSIGLSLNYSKYQVIGVKVAWERLSMGVFDLRGRISDDVHSCSLEHLALPNAENVVALIAQNIEKLTSAHPGVIAVGVAVPGPFHRGEGAVYLTADGCGSRVYFPFLEQIRARVALPVVIDHDAIAGALGYWWFRTNCDARMALLYLLASEGIGGGVVSKGQVITGQRGHSAEMGHMIVEFGGRKCVCGGRGCLDAYASSIAVEKHARRLLPEHPGSRLAGKRRVGIADIFSAMRRGDELASRLVRDAGVHMGQGFASLIPIFDPDLIVIGDLMAFGGDVLLAGINDALERSLSRFYKKPRIVLADPGDDLVLLGSAAIAIDHAYNRPTELLMPGAS